MKAVLLLAAVLPGCTLIDQNTFRAGAGDAPVRPKPPVVAAPAPAPPGPPALLTLRMDQPGDWRVAVRQGVAAARARKPSVVFDVVQSVPVAADPGTVQAGDAVAVARVIEAEGIPAPRVRLAARPGTEREVRVYVR